MYVGASGGTPVSMSRVATESAIGVGIAASSSDWTEKYERCMLIHSRESYDIKYNAMPR